MRKVVLLLGILILSTNIWAKKSPIEIKYSVMDLQALRYYPFTIEIDSLVHELVLSTQTSSPKEKNVENKKSSVDIIGNKELLLTQLTNLSNSNNFIYKYALKPYVNWLQHSAPLNENDRELTLTLGLNDKSIYNFIGNSNVNNIINELFGDINLFKESNQVMFNKVNSPLAKKNLNSYKFFLSSSKAQNQQYEIVFYPKDLEYSGFIGYLYITESTPHKLVKAVFTLNSAYNFSSKRNILFTQYFEEDESNKLNPTKKDYILSWGDEITGSLQVNKTVNYNAEPIPLSASESKLDSFIKESNNTKAYNNFKAVSRLFLTDHYSINGERGIFEFGPITRFISYNKTEGLRLRLGGNTTTNLHNQWLFGGYAAYGFNDKEWKYRGDIMFSFTPKDRDIWEFPKRLLSFSYINDLNIPGADLLTSKRDFFAYSFSHIANYNMTKQKLFSLDYEHEFENNISFKVGGKHIKDETLKGREYSFINNNIETLVNKLTSSEVNFAFRYAPNEVFFQTRHKRRYLRNADYEINIKHRIGLKDLFGSDYSYHITDINVLKELKLPNKIGKLSIELDARKVWSRLPYPFLFIEGGNQSYIFKEDNHNLMDYSEFITDNFVAGIINTQFNWSPIRLLYKNKSKTNIGVKAIYGPMSDKNNPNLHPELFVIGENIKTLNDTPYIEVNFGFSNILKFFRLEWVQRLTYLERDSNGNKKSKGSLFVGANFSF
ncbi:hypothetical protein M2138_001384 [Dysgonomonadaceae bacterium PH5-43]|nr:hypothetical protein [Dysgonomonadaceae bacterium PH5-43]